MSYQQLKKQADGRMGQWCRNCPVCNGRACGNHIPGPGSKGSGTTAAENFDAWKKYKIVIDTIAENTPASTAFDFFGTCLQYPILAGPVGAVDMHYSDAYNDVTYNQTLLAGCRKAGIAAFTGDGMDSNIMKTACESIAAVDGYGIPTIKPWPEDIVKEKMQLVQEAAPLAAAMDIDAAGLPFLKSFTPPAGRKTPAEMKRIIEASPAPFLVKGILSVKGALKALEAGAAGIIVSNHGGRVLDEAVPTAEVLEEIVQAVNGRMMVLVDGGIRSGADIFKALALGADGVLIARPYVNAVYAAGEEGVQALTEQLGNELKDTMEMCGAGNLQEIRREMIRKL